MIDYSVSYSKGLAIILMVLGHTMFSTYGNAWISMFDVPLFFFVSGLCFKDKYKDNVKLFIKNKLKGIYVPWVKWSVLFILLHNAFLSIGLYSSEILIGNNRIEPYTLTQTLGLIRSAIIPMTCNEPLIGGFWFLFDLFWGSMFFIFTLWICKKKFHYIGLCYLPLSMIANYVMAGAHQTIYRVLLATFMIFCGYYYKEIRKRIHIGYITMTLAFILVTIGAFFWEGSAHYVTATHQLPFVLTSIVAIVSILELFSRLEIYKRNKCMRLLNFFGTNSLTVLTWHFMAFKIVSLIIIGIYGLDYVRIASFPVIEEYSKQGWWILYLTTGMYICGILALLNKKIGNSMFKL